VLTTVCSSCSTEFLVTPEQLKRRGGRVRCGKCETVFDALASLTQRTNQNGLRQSTPVIFDPEPEAPVANAEFRSDDVPMAGVADPAPQAETFAVQAELTATGDGDDPVAADIADSVPDAIKAAALSTSDPKPAQPWIKWPVSNPVNFPAPEVPAKRADTDMLVTLEAPSLPGQPERSPPPSRAPAAPAPAFDFGPQAATRRSRWWALLAGVFLLLLIGQATYYFRGAIAFLAPETKPFIFEVCATFGCEIPLPRRAELISIETSDLQADPTNPGVIVLSATLRNRAAFPQTFPALELTLTNERDQPLARRVLQARDYLADKTEAFEGSSEKQIRLNIEAGSVKASGYRLYLFYP